MKIEFIKSYILNGKKQVVGQKMTVWPTLGERLIREGVATEYNGRWPPKKTKTNFFKPK